MKNETVLYGVREENESWQEEILSTNPARFDEIKKLAAQDGWGRFRIVTIDLSRPPDFASTIKRGR